ncbi:hypothetical protein FOA52_014404 [Chlamydomonas sp. UWO 241]|nr:hypothetical protein FOA52_014404 [Chlamydomonas sp. UWO 241]
MSSVQTTHSHSIHSQFKPDFQKEWIHRENRKQAASGEAFVPGNSFLRSSLFEPIDSAPIEHRHHAVTKSLAELRTTYQQPPASSPAGHTCRSETTPAKVVGDQPLSSAPGYMPHLSHAHHFGWNPPTPAVDVRALGFRADLKMGMASKYQHKIGVNLSLISSRKV